MPLDSFIKLLLDCSWASCNKILLSFFNASSIELSNVIDAAVNVRRKVNNKTFFNITYNLADYKKKGSPNLGLPKIFFN